VGLLWAGTLCEPQVAFSLSTMMSTSIDASVAGDSKAELKLPGRLLFA
jgi:hypothetical protein